MKADVVVVGAGIVGTATAWELARRGVRVTLVDRAGVSEGTTGLGEGNALCSDKDAGPELDLAVAGLRRFEELEAVVGPAARIRRKGALVVHPDARTWAEEPARVARLQAAGVEARLVDPEQARALEPQLTGPVHGATFVPGDLQCDPRAITRALAVLAAEHGALVRTGAEVVAVDDGVRLADGEHLAAREVVIAAGPWSAALTGLPLEPRKGQLTRLRLPAPDASFLRRKVVDASYLLAVEAAGAGRQLATVVETTWDGHVVVGSTRERVGFDDAVDHELACEVRTLAARLVPAVADLPVDDTWIGFRPWLPDGLPAIGALREGVWAGTGHEGAGVVLGPITGRLLAQAICGEPPGVDLAPFAPGRFA